MFFFYVKAENQHVFMQDLNRREVGDAKDGTGTAALFDQLYSITTDGELE